MLFRALFLSLNVIYPNIILHSFLLSWLAFSYIRITTIKKMLSISFNALVNSNIYMTNNIAKQNN